MRVSRAEMDKSHERIVAGAARLLREQGVENTSVADVMETAGLTHGGFYRHFANKEALVAAALQHAFAQVTTMMEGALGARSPTEAQALYRGYYLSDAHLSQPGAACPVAMLAGDIARAEPALKDAFGEGVNCMVDSLERMQAGRRKQGRAEAIREFALLVGAAVIARASDPDTARSVISACRDA